MVNLESMTKEEAINTLSGLRRALAELSPNQARLAFDALMSTPGVVTTAFTQAADFQSALATLRQVFGAMDKKGIESPSD
jgi:hypothetical protein